jgi:hypothetical protein
VTTQITNTYSIFLGFVGFFYTLFYENIIPIFGFLFGPSSFWLSYRNIPCSSSLQKRRREDIGDDGDCKKETLPRFKDLES